MASRKNGTLYVGVTSNLVQRVWQHKAASVHGFTKNHKVARLVYFEVLGDMTSAIFREKQLKRCGRKTKLELISKDNPRWRDLWPLIAGEEPDRVCD